MLIPNASELARRRWTVRTAVRCAALFLASIAILPIVSWATEGFMDDDFFDLWYYADRIALAVFCLIVGAVAWITQGLLVRLIVPIPKGTRCPRCNHNIAGMHEPVCTECGLELTPEFIDTIAPGGAVGAATPDPRILPFVTANRRAIATGFLRVFGVIWLCWALLALIGSLITLIMIDDDGYYTFAYAITSLVQSVLMTLSAVIILYCAPRLARFCVPTPNDPLLNPTETPEIPEPDSPTKQSGNEPAGG